MKIRITTVRTLPGWDMENYCRDMAKNGVPFKQVEEFRKKNKTSVIYGNPNSETYQITTYEVITPDLILVE